MALKSTTNHYLNRVGESAWGLASCSEKAFVAASDNSHKITLFSSGVLSPPVLGCSRLEQIVFRGHTHNIPFIDISSSGHYLASSSIDHTCILWDVATGQQVYRTNFVTSW